MGTTPRNLGERIRYARRLRGLTQVQLASRSGISQPALSSLEIGDTTTPEAGTLLRLALSLSVDPYWLDNGRAAMTPSIAYDGADPVLLAALAELSLSNRRLLLAMANALIADQQAEDSPVRPSLADPFPGVPRLSRSKKTTP